MTLLRMFLILGIGFFAIMLSLFIASTISDIVKFFKEDKPTKNKPDENLPVIKIIVRCPDESDIRLETNNKDIKVEVVIDTNKRKKEDKN